MFNPSRADARHLFFDTWRKYQAQEPVVGIEAMVLELVLQHPEYHALLSRPEQYQDSDYPPELGTTNPFLHLSLHLAINEQHSINQPVGIQQRYADLLAQHGEPHAAQHALMECLAEMIWQAQRRQTAPDAGVYFECLDRKIALKSSRKNAEA